MARVSSTEILYRKIQKQKMKMMFADLLIRIMQHSEPIDTNIVNNIFEEEYNKRF